MATDQPLPVALAQSPVRFVLRRDGGAVTHARLSIWSGVGTANERRQDVLFFDDVLDDEESFTRNLAPGTYTCVLHVFIREDLNGRFRYEHRVAGRLMALEEGDVNAGAQDGEGALIRHNYALDVA